MKKLALVLAVVLSVGAFAACAPKNDTPPTSGSQSVSAPAEKKIEGELADIMPKLYEGIPDDKSVGTMDTPVTAEMSESFTGVTSDKYKEALASDAMIGSIAHSVVLVRANSAADAEALAKEIEEKADPRKWICVEAEKKIVDRVDDVVILIMSFEDNAKIIHDNFLALAK